MVAKVHNLISKTERREYTCALISQSRLRVQSAQKTVQQSAPETRRSSGSQAVGKVES